MMLALIRPDSWNFPLFLHILGATLLFGTVATVANRRVSRAAATPATNNCSHASRSARSCSGSSLRTS